jgi:hypothetical protein
VQWVARNEHWLELLLLVEEHSGYSSPVESHQRRVILVLKSLIKQPKGSKLIETKLSRVRAPTKMRFLIKLGEMRTLLSFNGEDQVGMRDETK